MYIADIYVCINVSIHVSSCLHTQIHVHQAYTRVCTYVCSVYALAYCVSGAPYCEDHELGDRRYTGDTKLCEIFSEVLPKTRCVCRDLKEVGG